MQGRRARTHKWLSAVPRGHLSRADVTHPAAGPRRDRRRLSETSDGADRGRRPGKLDDREWAIIRTHTLEGQKMLERVGGFMSEVGEIVRASHERWDGGGYPDGLRGGAIPLEARIVSCCDAFNAMTTTRSYRRAMPVSAALAELIDNAGTQFDPRVVDALVQVVG
jgi:HD-GYP domain-containing protein (c-di-GMP phosphodiesterase class II)